MDTQEREKLITGAVAEFEAGLRSKAEQFEATHAERKLTISGEEKLVQEKNSARRSGNKPGTRGNRNGRYRPPRGC